MSTARQRGTIRKIQPVQTAPFDEQFWPVSLALCLTAAIAAGASVSLLRGPWMWAVLVSLPALLVSALVALQRVRPGLLKRSLQLAVILSAGLHLLFLIFCSLTDVFGKPEVAQPVAENKPAPERVMLVTQRESNPIWRELNRRETLDPVVEVEREPTRTETLPPQPMELAQPRPTPTPASSRRAEVSPAQPKLDQNVSQLRRSAGEAAPTSAAPTSAAVANTAASAAEPAASPRRETSQPSERATSAQQRPSESTLDEAVAAAPAAPAAKPTEAQAARRANALGAALAAAPEPAASAQSSTARTRDRQVEIPQTAAARGESPRLERPASRTSASEQSTNAARAEQTETVLRAMAAELQASSVQAEAAVAQARRREREPTLPSIAQENQRAELPRRSNQAAEQVASLRPIEAPSPAPAVASGSANAPQASSTSLTRADSGSALAAAGVNLQVNDLQAAGVASVASDSLARRRAESTADAPKLLNSQQAANERRTVADSPTPQSAWQVNSDALASRSGAQAPAPRSSESSAALSTSAASNADRSRLNVESGSSQLDLGPTKLVADAAAERASGGGGAPSLGPLNPEPKTAQRSAAATAGTLASEVVGLTQAPRSAPRESRASGEPQPSEAQSTASRDRNANSSATNGNELAELEAGLSAAVARETQSSASSRREDVSGMGGAISAAEAAERQTGNQREGISRAPLAQVEVQLGSLSGKSDAASPAAGEAASPTESRRTGSSSALAAETLEPGTEGDRPDAATTSATRRAAASAGGNAGLEAAAEETAGASPRRGSQTGGPKVDSPALAGTGPSRQATGRADQAEAELGAAGRRKASAANLEVAAEIGSPGLGLRPDDALGSPLRPSSRDSESLALSVESRFHRAESGAQPEAATDAVLAKEAFESRGAPLEGSAPSTEAAIELGLEFLARHQRADGSWSLGGFDLGHPQKQGQFNSDMAATGLALLAFQGAGYTHREFKYAAQMQRAMDWMIARQDAEGGLYLEADARSNQNCRMYSHAIAALALNEAYGMTQDSDLREPCRKALAYIVNTQDDRGGWRYYAEPQLRQTDTSVTGWMLMALQSGRLSGLEVPAETWKRIDEWLQVAGDPQREGLYRYNPFAEDSGGVDRSTGRKPTVSMTSVGMLMRLYTGWERTDPRTLAAADYLLSQQMPGDRTSIERDTYYWYYATQVLRHVGGERWERWNAQLHPLLIRTQVKAGELSGSWHPYEPVPDRWGPAAGRLYVTTMNLLSLEVNYRLLPLYEQYRTASGPD